MPDAFGKPPEVLPAVEPADEGALLCPVGEVVEPAVSEGEVGVTEPGALVGAVAVPVAGAWVALVLDGLQPAEMTMQVSAGTTRRAARLTPSANTSGRCF